MFWIVSYLINTFKAFNNCIFVPRARDEIWLTGTTI